jgi:hypothetical protein
MVKNWQGKIMKFIRSKELGKALCAALAVALLAPAAWAYPPDNAAVLYYRACLLYSEDSAIQSKLHDLLKGKVQINEEITDYVTRQNASAMKYFVDAGDAPHCDWGLDYSEGYLLVMPHYATLRNLARIVLTDAKIAAEAGEYKLALDRCLTVHKLATHLGGDILIGYLVGMASNTMANDRIVEILCGMPADAGVLTWLKTELGKTSARMPSPRAGLSLEKKCGCMAMQLEKRDELLALLASTENDGDVHEQARERLAEADEAFFDRSRAYFINHMNRLDKLLSSSLSYAELYEQLKQLGEKPRKEATKNDDAVFTAFAAPAFQDVYTIDVKSRNYFGALAAAIDIYMMKVKSGRLPDSLPAGLPKDLFSGKDFKYERTKDGFKLRCQGKDLSKDKIYEYKFKVKE